MPKVLSWPIIIAILVVEALSVGLLLGFIDTIVPLPAAVRIGGLGAAVGILAALLINLRRSQLAAQETQRP